MKNQKNLEHCGICGCRLHRGKGSYAKSTLEGRSHATEHHFVAERFFGRSANRSSTLRQSVFRKCPWGLEGNTGVFCYECHELLLHNPVLLPEDLKAFSELVCRRKLNERAKAAGVGKIGGRIKLFQEIIAAGIRAVQAKDGEQAAAGDVRNARA